MIAAMIAYIVLACGVVCLVGYLAHVRSSRELRRATDVAIAEVRSTLVSTRSSDVNSPHVWLSESVVQEAPFDMALPSSKRPFVLLTIKRQPESAATLHPALWGALLLTKVDDLEKGLGGSGVKLDVSGSTETATAVTLMLVPRTTAGASRRLTELRDRLIEWKRVVKEGVRMNQDNDLNWLAECELANELDAVAIQPTPDQSQLDQLRQPAVP